MFKFATNKFSNASNPHNTQTSSSSTPQPPPAPQTKCDDSSRRRFQIQKDLFSFNKIADKGFPSKPSAMDYDKKLKLLAIGTRNGDIRIYGEPYTQQQQLSCYQDVHPFPILKLLFVHGQHQLITLSERVYRNDLTNKGESHLYLILWQIPNLTEQHPQTSNLVEKIKEFQLDPKIVNNTRLSALTLLNDNSHLFIGFETGDVYVFNVTSFQLVPGVINKDYILKNIPSDISYKKLTQLGAVESISHHPRQLTKLLIAYQRGLWIVFDFIKNQIDQINQTQQQLESAVFYQQGECVATSHSDGSFILWDLTASTQTNVDQQPAACSSNSAPNIVYGPYPCKSVSKCVVKTARNDQPYVIFSGGCPRVNYSDKITISVIQGENSHVCFDFTSKIIDFFTIDKPSIEKNVSSQNTVFDNPQALFVLLEEEFVAIDLVSDGWPQFKLPYLYSVHSSAIICTHYVNGVSTGLYERLRHFGSLCQDPAELFSDRDWPINNLSNPQSLPNHQPTDRRDLLLTGHEDGSVRFWDVTHMTMSLIYHLKTSEYFQTDSTPSEDQTSEPASDNWPPFRKVGTFDPYSDDPKLGIQKIFLCPQKEVLVVAGTAGQVLIMSLNDQPRVVPYSEIKPHKINIIGVSPEVESHFVWKGHEPLLTRGNHGNQVSQDGSLKILPGYQLHSLIQLYPPATVSALALNTDWQMVAMGTSHGFALFDYLHLKDLLIRCTLDPAMLLANSANDSGNGGTTISRRKSLKKSLRESFRKLRRGRSQKAVSSNQIKSNPLSKPAATINEDDLNDLNHKPIERQVESREFKPMDDIPPSVIRYMYFVRTFITSGQQQTNSLWVGTNTGVIYIYALQFMSGVNKGVRTNQSVNCLLAKEMRLKHRAPVVHIQVIDQNMRPLPADVSQSVDESNQQSHKVIICSEEQFKVFQLPALKPVCKFKLTAVEGARVRRIGYNSYTSKNDARYSEFCLSCLSNLGDLSVYSLPQLKRQVQIQCMKQQDINAITSFVFTKQGQAFYLQSASEFVHISMSARDSPQLIQQSLVLNQTQKQLKEKEKQSPVSPVGQVKKESPAAAAAAATALTSPFSPPSITTEPMIISNSPPTVPVPAPRTTVNVNAQKDETSQRNSNNESTEPNNAPTEDSSASFSHLSTSVMSSPTSKPLTSKTTDVANSSMTQSGVPSSQSALILNQSNISTITLNNNNNNTNSSLLTGQSESFNANSSGYNGSSTCAGNSGNNTTINMSMDSVVDRFNDEFNEVSTKKIPSAIDEDSSTNQSDSMLNESEVSSTGKKHTEARLNENGSSLKLNENGAKSEATTDEDDGIDLAPQKSSSPLIKLNNNANSSLQNGNGRSNKIEQVTKRIENGNKLEYRETAID